MSETPPSRVKVRILLVDDEPSIHEQVNRALCSPPPLPVEYEVVSAFDIHSAGNILMHDHIDVILLDLRMNRESAESAKETVRIIDVWSRRKETPPIIVMTGHGTDGLRLECFQAGADEFISKLPYMERAHLVHFITSAILRRATRDANG